MWYHFNRNCIFLVNLSTSMYFLFSKGVSFIKRLPRFSLVNLLQIFLVSSNLVAEWSIVILPPSSKEAVLSSLLGDLTVIVSLLTGSPPLLLLQLSPVFLLPVQSPLPVSLFCLLVPSLLLFTAGHLLFVCWGKGRGHLINLVKSHKKTPSPPKKTWLEI